MVRASSIIIVILHYKSQCGFISNLVLTGFIVTIMVLINDN